MKKTFSIVLNVVLLLFGLIAAGQKTIVVIGSSTAEGFGASILDSSWVKKLQFEYRKNSSDGVDTNIVNLALGGTNTYNGMPTGFIPPGLAFPDPTRNITKALTYNPNVIIVSYPSNDIAVGHTKLEIMNNLRTIYQTAVAGGAMCFITTTQPRNFYPNTLMMDYQRDLVDSIENVFGFFAIDFWTDLVSTVPANDIRPAVAYGDGIHVNDLGHRLLFQQVLAKQIFPLGGPLPVKLLSFSAITDKSIVSVKWSTAEEDPGTSYDIERSSNGREFSKAATIAANGNAGNSNYSWSDQHPLDGKSYYRLKVSEPSKIFYSKVVIIDTRNRSFNISSIYADGNNLHVKLSNYRGGSLEATLVNLSGSLLKKQKMVADGSGQLAIPIGDIVAGEYILQLSDVNGNSVSHRFMKLK